MAINFLAVFAASVAALAVGALWYSPLLFGKAWMKEVGIGPAQMEEIKKKKGMGKRYALAYLICLLSSFSFGLLASRVGVIHPGGALKLALLLWVGFILPPVFSPVLWQGKSLKLFALNGGYYLAFLTAIALVLAALLKQR